MRRTKIWRTERRMTKFSVRGEDGEGPSKFPWPKRQRISSSLLPSQRHQESQPQSNSQTQPQPQSHSNPPSLPSPMEAEEEDDDSQLESEEEEEEDDEHDQEQEQEEAANNQDNQVALAEGPSRSSSGGAGPLGSTTTTTRTGAISVTLTDPEVLDCPICCEPFTIPVFQCDNGHTACSPCCSKLLQKCPSCSLPIGYNRCRAIEKVLESVKVPCQNMEYGCKEIVSYSKRYGHDKTCDFIPCSCPHSGCSFIGSSKQLYRHYGTKHRPSRISFLYNHRAPVLLTTSQKFLVFQEKREGVLFILYNKVEILGNMMTVCCIGPPSWKRRYFYELAVKTEESSLKLQSFTKTIQSMVGDPPSAAGFLLVPGEFFGSYGQISLDLSIWRHHE